MLSLLRADGDFEVAQLISSTILSREHVILKSALNRGDPLMTKVSYQLIDSHLGSHSFLM